MNLFGAIARHRGALASGATLTAAAVTVTTLAALYPGIPTADLDLDDGGVWVTKSSDLLVGHLNYPSRLLDGAARARAGEFDVLQAGPTVLVHDETGSTLSRVDPATVTFDSPTSVPAGAQVALGAETVAVRSGSDLFVLGADALPGATFGEEAAVASLDGAGGVAVSSDGSAVYATSAEAGVVTTVSAADGSETARTQLDGVDEEAELTVAAVDGDPVVLDASRGVLYLPSGGSVDLPDAESAVLQLSAADSDAAYIATPTALLRQPLGGGTPEVLATVDQGVPAAPVWLNGCAYAVWSGSGAYVRWCLGDTEAVLKDIDVSDSAELVLRTNRRVVVVNDVTAGTVWIVEDDVQKVDNWDDVTPPADDDAAEDESQEETPQYDLPERSAQNNPPTAVDDDFGVRAGRTALLPVTDNDTDPDGDLLAATLQGEVATGYSVASVLGGASLQVDVPANATGETSFTYTVDDGRGGTDTAVVALSVHDDSVNGAPEQRRVNTVQVEVGASVTYAALDGWIDPDGDDFYLKSAEVDGADAVTYRSNGVLEFTSASKEPGIKEVRLLVSDGREDAEGVLRVDVRVAGTVDPVANNDRVTAVAGIPTTVSPLANDLSPSGEPLRISRVDTLPGVTLTPNYTDGTFDFLAEAPGSYYVQYLVTDGPRSAVGLVRIDVLAADAGPQPPVAVRDLAMLPTGRSVLIDVLANDSDPTGGILVVQSARASDGAPISVEVLNHGVLRITDLAGLATTVTVAYTVSNGEQSATGQVVVLPVALPETLRPPVAVEDSAVVRVGDVVTVPVMANDYHPDGDEIALVPELVEIDAPNPEAMFVSAGAVRYQAGSEPGTVYATYEIEDSQQNRTAGYVTIQVLPADEGTNSPPRPKPVIGRAIAGATERIAIPLDGIDADGDSVELVGLSSNPSKGRVTVGESWLTYEASPGSVGRDTFTYTVRDRLGAVGESTVTVGIAPPGYENQAPYAAKDTVSVRPGRAVAVAVTANDSDPDGDAISLSEDLVVDGGIDASVAGGRVVIDAPDVAGDYTIAYTISDDFGATAQGVLLVTVDPDAPLRAPIARDDRASVLEIEDDLVVRVAVLDNDEDPDGTLAGLEVSVASEDASVAADGTVTIPVDAASRVVRYRITDQDGQIGQAFIFVPGTSSLVPTLSRGTPLEVVSGESVDIALTDWVRVREGRAARIATADSVAASHADVSDAVVDESTLRYSAAVDYYGPDSLGVMVTDGAGPDDPEALSAFVMIPITVLPAENQSPTLRNASVTVAPGEDAASLNLAKLAYDPDEEDRERLQYAIVGGVPAGYQASIAGSVLTVAADASAEPGDVVELGLEVSDGVTEPGAGTVTLTTVTSQRPLPVANDDVVGEAAQGQTQNVDVLANDYNPFEDRGPLEVVSARVDSGRGTAVVDGDRVAVSPAADFVGTMIVTYRIADATKAEDRRVDGRITVTVRGRPDAPGTPTVTSIQDQTVVLSWGAPSNNGAAITEYRVTSPQGYSRSCGSTTCTLDGLTNDVEYTFSVTAVNAVGESDPSPASASARPDARPDTPSAPSLVFGDGSVDVSWATPNSHGSPVLGYNLEISPAPATGSLQKTGVTGNSLTWTGLQNGVAYQVRVQAVNRAPDPSEWSAYSAGVVPAGAPEAPGQPSTTAATPVGSQAQIAVTWSPPASDNGDAVADYALTVKRGGTVVNTITTSGTSQNVVVDTSETDYTFSVTARNKAGSSAASADSVARRGAVAPGAPSSVSATPGDRNLAVAFTPGPLNGSRAGEMTYHYRVTPGGATGTLPAGGGTVPGLTNGTSYTVAVWATSSVQGVSPSGETSSNAAIPFGKPIVSVTQVNRKDRAVEFVWNINANGRPITATNAPQGGEGTVVWTKTGLEPGQSYTLNLSYTNEAGTSTTSATGQANDPPPPRTWLTRSGNTVVYHWENLPANMWPEVTAFRCWSVPQGSQQGGHGGAEGGNGAWQVAGSFTTGSGSIAVPCGSNVTDSYSVEPWKYGPWLTIGQSWTG